MSIIAFTSVGTSPGITSTAIALTLAWPRPAVLIEADTSKPSTVVSGYMRGSVSSHHGLTALTQIHGVHGIDRNALWESMLPLASDIDDIPEGHNKYVLAAHSNPDVAAASSSFWSSLSTHLPNLSEGIDVIIDLGRWNGSSDYRNGLLSTADWAFFGTRLSLQSVAALRSRIDAAIELRTSHGHLDHHSILGYSVPAGGYPLAELARFFNVRSSGTIPFDPRWGAVYAEGQVPPAGFWKGTYQGAINALASTAEKHLATTRDLLDSEGESR